MKVKKREDVRVKEMMREWVVRVWEEVKKRE